MSITTLTIATACFAAWLLASHTLRYLYKLWMYKQIKKSFYNSWPNAYYPPMEKPTFLFKNKKQQNERR